MGECAALTIRVAARIRVDTPGRPPLFLVREADLGLVPPERGGESTVWLLVRDEATGTETWEFWRMLGGG